VDAVKGSFAPKARYLQEALKRSGMTTSSNVASHTTAKQSVNDRAVRLLASSIYRQLQDEGCEARDIISVSSQLIDLVTTELQKIDHQQP
jgi:hypothetical protein